MWISKLTIQDIRGFTNSQSIDLSHNINLFVGQNNAGKSTLLNSILLTQKVGVLTEEDITLNEKFGKIELVFENLDSFISKYGANFFRENKFRKVYFDFNRSGGSQRKIFTIDSSSAYEFSQSDSEPQNLIYPYLSKRKVTEYEESVNLQATNSVIGNFRFLSAKIARLCNVTHPKSAEYQKYCNEIIGFPISTVASFNGQKAAYILESFLDIPLDSMGEGVSNLLGLIVDLCIAEDKIFLIEEPENDIHPQALKSLLELITKKSETNQFFISTHSNIVTKYLGSVENSKVFRVSMIFNERRLPISKVKEVKNEPSERLKLLEELGYEPFDFGQFSAWLFLEESSAETIIKNFLIPNFVPKLKTKLRTYSAGSRDEVEKKFRDFNNLFVFIHLEPTYKNKAWVLIDSGKDEEVVIDRMKEYYLKHGWNEDNFLQLSKHNFEEYYPDIFQQEFAEILALTDKGVKKHRKKELLEKVLKWIEENPEDAKTEFAIFAKDVIDVLKKIAKSIN